MKISVRELRQHLSKYLHLAQEGELVEIQSRGKSVAMLCPCTQEGCERCKDWEFMTFKEEERVHKEKKPFFNPQPK